MNTSILTSISDWTEEPSDIFYTSLMGQTTTTPENTHKPSILRKDDYQLGTIKLQLT